MIDASMLQQMISDPGTSPRNHLPPITHIVSKEKDSSFLC